jgi:uncharacterized protein (UPF0371 family)
VKTCFDCDTYIELQTAKINERVAMFDNKLYLEFGGKIFDDLHAARILPGFRPGIKTEMLQTFKDQAEIIFCINAGDIETKRIRADYGISYDVDLLRLVEKFKAIGIPTAGVVITLYTGQPAAEKFARVCQRRGIKTYFHSHTKGYPTDVDTIVSEEGYGAQPYVETSKPLVVVAAPGPNSGKLATCLSQLYHEYRRGVRAGYAKFETFPVWNLPLKHPVNMAYEAATADIHDVNMIDSFHLEKYGVTTVNYNRDLETFPVLKNILHRIIGHDLYYSPTDMGVNMVGLAITDDPGVRRAACDEIIRRYLNSLCDYKNGLFDISTPQKIKMLMDELGVAVSDRPVVAAALNAKDSKGAQTVAIELDDPEATPHANRDQTDDDLPGATIICGRDNDIMTAPAAAVINSIKSLAGIEDHLHLISPVTLKAMLDLKRDVYQEQRLNLLDVLAALALSEITNPTVELAMSYLPRLRGLEAHSSMMLPRVEIDALKKLGLNVTCSDDFGE